VCESRLWLESWEWQCCGEPFKVGSEVVVACGFAVVVVTLDDDVRERGALEHQE
jgi:hypothetical protein